jgi:hypothetical protein
LEIASGKGCEPINSACRVKVTAALTAMAEFINLIALKHGLPNTLFDLDGKGAGADAEGSLKTLRNGADYEHQNFAQIKAAPGNRPKYQAHLPLG